MENKEQKANDATLENDGAEEVKPRRKRRRRRRRANKSEDAENTTKEKASDAALDNDGENDGAEEAKPRRKRRRRRPREYEFDDAENTILSRLAAKMTLVGLVGLAACVLAAGGLCVFFFRLPAGLPAMVNGVFFVALVWVGIGLLVSAWNLKAAHHFKIIVSTAGEDVPQLMSALGQLDRIYLVQCVFAVGGVVLFLLGLLTGDGVSAGPPTFAPPKVG